MEYKTLAGYEEIEVNEMGEVRWSDVKSRRKQPTIWYGAMFNTYYLKYTNYETNKDKSVSMFNLVAKCFVGNPHNYKFVQTINGDNSDYKISNLQWVKSRKRKPKIEDC